MALTCTPMSALAATQELGPDVKVLDLARVIPSGQVPQVESTLDRLEREQGWRVRISTRYQPNAGPSLEELRSAWRPDKRTLVVLVDTSAPNILNFKYGEGVLTRLRRPFFSELSSRFGNQFYVRDNGESAAVMAALDALLGCLEKEDGCLVVPGLSADEYYFTLATSVFGGFVFGFANLLEPSGFVQRKWVWVLLFAPLWGSLYINFGIGPIVSRTSDILPIVGNTAGFLAAAALVSASPMFRQKLSE